MNHHFSALKGSNGGPSPKPRNHRRSISGDGAPVNTTVQATSGSSSLVHKLFFPGYTNSGSNDTFRAPTAPAAASHANNTSSPQQTSILDVDESASSVGNFNTTLSTAETELFDNRTALDNKPLTNLRFLATTAAQQVSTAQRAAQPQNQQQHLRPRVSQPSPILVRASTDVVPDIRRTKSMDSTYPERNLLPHHGPSIQTTQPSSLPPLFASTKPRTTKMPPAPQPQPQVIQSPPLLARRPISIGDPNYSNPNNPGAQRSLSTTVLADGQPEQGASPALDKSAVELLDAPAPSDVNGDRKTDKISNATEKQEPQWEEEATPAQTAFGKELLFARKLNKKSAPSDPNTNESLEHETCSSEGVLSTASEMGTVINAGRLAELDAELEHDFLAAQEEGDEFEEEDGDRIYEGDTVQHSLDLPSFSDPSSPHNSELTKLRPRPQSTLPLINTKISDPASASTVETPPTNNRQSVNAPAQQGTPMSQPSPSGLSPARLSLAIRKTMESARHVHHVPQKENRHNSEHTAAEHLPTEESSSRDKFDTDTPEDECEDGQHSPHRIESKSDKATTENSKSANVLIPQSFSWSQGEGIEVTLSPKQAMRDESFRTDTAEIESSSFAPTSFLLRSPGSSAFLMASSQKKTKKRSLWKDRKSTGDESTHSWRSEENNFEEGISSLSSKGLAFPSSASSISASSSAAAVTMNKAMQRRNVTWSTQKTWRVPIVDENEELQHPETSERGTINASETISEESDFFSPLREERLSLDEINLRKIDRSASYDFDGTKSTISSGNGNTNSRAMSVAGSTHVLLGSSMSWDAASSFKSPLRGQQRKPPNYEAVFATGRGVIGEYTANAADEDNDDDDICLNEPQPPPPPNDFSPWVPNLNLAEELKTPQRIEIEREDAIDILACLVERGVSLHHTPSPTKTSLNSSRKKFLPPDNKPMQIATSNTGTEATPTVTIDEMSSVVEGLKAVARTEQDDDKRRHTLNAIDDLLKSHIYAIEMSQAAKSACSWLKSIGREDVFEGDEKDDNSTEKKEDDSSILWQSKVSATPRDSIDALTTKAKLHAAEDQLAARAIEAQKLNEELAQCRAEIGRLKSASQTTTRGPFRSPNRSILDEEETEEHSDEDVLQTKISTEPDEQGRISMYKTALENANTEIAKLHMALISDSPKVEIPENPPVFVVDNEESGRSFSPRSNDSPGNKDQATINVHMLDGENFMTDWSEAPPLPPPPEHNLRSPMVQSVLEAWTDDDGLHQSMFAWMDQVLTGVDPESIPPLTISSLDHQVKDGFTLHVLPLLLRRKDIRVDVKTRVQRRTTYDLAISVDRPSITGLDMRRHLETIAARSDVGGAGSVTHSAVTAHMANMNGGGDYIMKSSPEGVVVGNPMSPEERLRENNPGPKQQRLMYDEMAEDMEDLDGTHPSGLMSALGGALGGFLTRNRKTGEISGQASVIDQSNGNNQQDSTPFTPSQNGTAAAELDDEQPYHRVVSAPSGRIGVTFVEFRGHAMVSDVAPDSPLQGWIFPSDILIAIDELPVSGMRVRDIIQVLKDRMDRQRALRIISCHAMNEITDYSQRDATSPFGEAET